jgi:WD40 repeat protein
LVAKLKGRALTKDPKGSTSTEWTRWHSLAFSPNGRSLAALSDDGGAAVWDLATQRKTSTLVGKQGSVITSVDYSPDGNRIVAGTLAGVVAVWDLRRHNWVFEKHAHSDIVKAVAFSPEGHFLASVCRDGSVCIWDAATGRRIYSLVGHKDEVDSVEFSSDGLRLLTASKDNTVRVWDVRSGRQLSCLLNDHNPLARFFPDGIRIAVANTSGRVVIWDLRSQRVVWRDSSAGRTLSSIALSPDGTRMVASRQSGGLIGVWAAATPSEVAAYERSHRQLAVNASKGTKK